MSTADVLASLRWKKFPVLDDGFVCLVDAMGNDQSVVQAARVSYGEGTRKVSDDRGLIRYLMRHRHTTPFEMAEIKLLVRVPMDTWRQWIRHRMACLAAGTRIFFDLPGGVRRRGNQLYPIEIAELWRRFQPTRNRHRPDKQKNPLFRRDRARAMRLRQIDEDTLRIGHTRVVDVFRNGKKGVFRMHLADGKSIEATADHRFLFADGWHTLHDATGLYEHNGKAVWRDGDYFIYVNGQELLAPVLCKRPRVASKKISVARLVRIESFQWVGEKETYDIEVEGPHHNFIANGIVTHNSVNEYSTRYSIAIDAAQTTPPDQWRLQAKGNRQGSEGTLDPPEGEKLSGSEREFQRRARELYEERLARGVAREQARKDLPLSTYTEAYWKIDLHNLLHFLSLRMDDHAQWEIRQYAQTIGREIVQPLFPLVWEAFVDYRLEGMHLSRLERELIARLMKRLAETGRSQATEEDFLAVQDPTWAGMTRNRERDECRAKLQSLGILPTS
jgi:flavin-dependent thymidylate synthase